MQDDAWNKNDVEPEEMWFGVFFYQNKNILISMGINFLITTLIIGLSAPIYFMGLSLGFALIFLISILILVIVILELIVSKLGPKLLKKIQ